jgi:hypothetical protein
MFEQNNTWEDWNGSCASKHAPIDNLSDIRLATYGPGDGFTASKADGSAAQDNTRVLASSDQFLLFAAAHGDGSRENQMKKEQKDFLDEASWDIAQVVNADKQLSPLAQKVIWDKFQQAGLMGVSQKDLTDSINQSLERLKSSCHIRTIEVLPQDYDPVKNNSYQAFFLVHDPEGRSFEKMRLP